MDCKATHRKCPLKYHTFPFSVNLISVHLISVHLSGAVHLSEE